VPSPWAKRRVRIENAILDAGPRIGRALIVALHHFFAFGPLLALIFVYLFSWRVASIIGHWPRPSLDDPKFMAPGDGVADSLYQSVLVFLLVAAAGVIMFPLLTFVLRRAYARWWLITLIVVFVLGCVLVRLDPGSRFEWFFD
jgi:hypothetical protein